MNEENCPPHKVYVAGSFLLDLVYSALNIRINKVPGAPLRRLVMASRNKPDRKPLSVSLLRLTLVAPALDLFIVLVNSG